MMVLMVEAGERWAIPFERVARVSDTGRLRPYAFELNELAGLLAEDESLIPVWHPREFGEGETSVVVYYGNDGLAGLSVGKVLGVRNLVDGSMLHGQWLNLDNGDRARWFDLQELERRLESAPASSN